VYGGSNPPLSTTVWQYGETLGFSGGNGGGATPVPIPNTVVKPSSADGTRLATARESRTSPELFLVDHAGIAQLVERQPSKLNVAGPNPVARSKVRRGVEQSGSSSGS
jgi:hypothetical protein